MLDLCYGHERQTEEQALPIPKTQSASCPKGQGSCRTTVDTFPAGRLGSIGTDGSVDACHAMAYTHPAAFQIRRMANPRKNACQGGTPASACCVANTDVQTLWDGTGLINQSLWMQTV
jgi:hypothetical protein